MSIAEAHEAYEYISSSVFYRQRSSIFSRVTDRISGNSSRFDTDGLVQGVRDALERADQSQDARLFEQGDARTKV